MTTWQAGRARAWSTGLGRWPSWFTRSCSSRLGGAHSSDETAGLAVPAKIGDPVIGSNGGNRGPAERAGLPCSHVD